MNYLIFDNDIYYETKDSSGIVPKDQLNTIFTGPDKECEVAVIDTLQKQLVAPEKLTSKKDEIIASGFSGDYVTQSERIGQNLFQVIAIEKAKISKIYKYLGLENVRLVTPYGAALREFLKGYGLISENKRIVFLDYMGNQVLLTIFNNNVFTTPRRLSAVTHRVVSELTRSQENYKSIHKEEKEINFVIATNSKEIMDEVISSGLETKENIVYLSEKYPALKGLAQGKLSMHYLLPEQFIHLRKLKIVKRRMASLGIMLGVLGVFLIMLLGSFSTSKNASTRLKDLRLEESSQAEALKSAYRAKYKDILRSNKKIDLPYFIDSFIEALPGEYRIESITIKDVSSGYRFEAIVSCETKDRPIPVLVLPRSFKKASVENIFVKAMPGVRVVLDIL